MTLWQRFCARYGGASGAYKMERRVELLAIGLGILLLLQLSVNAVRLALLAEPAAIAPTMDSAATGQRLGIERVGAEHSDAIRARPLFWVSRRPAMVEQPDDAARNTAASAVSSLNKVVLLGVFGSGPAAGVIVRVDGQQRRVLHAQKLNGWTLDAVQRDSAEFTRGAQRVSLALPVREVQATDKPVINRPGGAREASSGVPATAASDPEGKVSPVSEPSATAAAAELGWGG